ncbi:O-antigen ligase family protein [Ottowia sp. GY511]|uniref:O-antigen ligase family protein n=1 Tax=Ottowia flava TaxID=2675430 RepID=A0ABW4L0R6_9BURK|nr:O-antigen ligase family protein [Ottowia sp. GY511]TXK27313.1 O-antigen ligase family protein [Ottowia sp. GY511]
MNLTEATHLRLTSLAAFLVPALALWLPSGYAWGIGLLFVGALAGAPYWWRWPVRPETRWLAGAIVVMALVWLHGSDWSKGVSVLNKPVRYALVLPCLLYLMRFPPQLRWLLAGIAVGAACGGLRALYEVFILGLDRPWTSAEKTSNAIQLGNLCGMFGVMCWLQFTVYGPRWRWPLRLAVLACCALGLLGSLLSQTRGGWLAIALCLPILFWLIAHWVSHRRALVGLLVLGVLLVPLGWRMAPQLEQRLDWAIAEVTSYESTGNANTSVGHRLDHWNLAWAMGREKPLLGWGEAGYAAEKARRVAAGQAGPAVLEYGHAHNEVIDQFVKRGLLGVAGLGVLYLVPLALFWPRRRTVGRTPQLPLDDEICIRLLGVTVVGAHMGFGLTQVFFAHYNGVMIYLALLIFLFATLHPQPARPPIHG